MGNNLVSYFFTEEQREEKKQQIFQQLKQQLEHRGTSLLLMLDSFSAIEQQWTPFSDWLESFAARTRHEVLLQHADVPVALRPWLIELDLQQSEDLMLLESSIDYALRECEPEYIYGQGGRAVCGWLTTTHSTAYLAKQLGGSSIQQRPDGGRSLLRFYNPAILAGLLTYLSSWQSQRLMAGLSSWSYLDGDGELTHLAFAEQRDIQLSFTLLLQEEQWQQLELMGTVNQALTHYRARSQRHQIPRFAENIARKLLLPGLARIHKRLDNADKRAMEVSTHYFLHIHPDFDRHPLIAARLDSVQSLNGTHLIRLLRQLTADQWNQIAEECQQADGAGPLLKYVQENY